MTTQTQGTLTTKGGIVLPLRRTEVRARVSAPIADVEVSQRFVNETRDTIEATYAFPLPAGASVYRMAFHIGDRVVRAIVRRKEDARRDYEAAIASGRAATLLEEDTSSLFTLAVGNIRPGAEILVELAYQELLAFDDAEWRFVFPMVAPERYVEMPESVMKTLLNGGQGRPGATLPASTIRPPRLPSGVRGPDVSIEVDLGATLDLSSLRCPSHPIAIEGSRVRLKSGDSIKNCDFVLTFRAGAAGVRPLVRFERNEGERGTFLLCFTPPREPSLEPTAARGSKDDLKALRCGNCGGVVTDLSSIKEIPGLGLAVPCRYCGAILAPSTERHARATRPRDVLILVDRSASMRGSLGQARRAVRALLDALAPGDAVQLVAFDHEREAFDGEGRAFVGLSPEVKARADAFLGSLTPRGGTELERLLARAGELPIRDGRTSSVVLVSDAAVGNEGRLIKKAKEHLGAHRRLYVLGLGPAVDRHLCQRLARACGGSSDVLGPKEDVEPVMARFARRVREGGAVLTGLSLDLEGAIDTTPSALPDLYGGEPLMVLGRYDETGERRWVLTGTTADGRPFRQHVHVELPSTGDSIGLARLWAKRTIDALIEREPSRELAERATALALEHSIVSKYTALVAIDAHASTGTERPRRIEQPAPEMDLCEEEAAPAPRMRCEAARDRAAPRACAAPSRPTPSRPRVPIEAQGSDAYSSRELEWLKERASGELDLVFLVDETGSMGPYIEEVKARLLDLVHALTRMPLMKSLRIGLVTYRDHPPQDGSYASRVVALSSDIAKIEDAVKALVANGGGDGPESVTDGLFDVVRLAWRPSAARAVVWFGDAPPHGVEPSGDGFPEGCPCGNHWYTQAESCREMGISIYAVGCLPNLRAYAGAEDVFKTVAKTTRGIYLPLTQADLLVPLMASAAANELDRRRIDEHVAEIVRVHEALLRDLDDAERTRWLAEVLAHDGVRPREMIYDEASPKIAPLRFRDPMARDVEGALERLRSAGRVAI